MKSATDLALKAFETRPSRAEPLADLAKHYRELGMNEVALMFCKRGLEIPPSDDMLFVEPGAQDELRETFAICAYYSRDYATRERGHEICNSTALRRIEEGVSDAQADVLRTRRDLARRNLFWYAKSATELMQSFAAERINFDPPLGYREMNPSICRQGDRVVMVVRCVNYEIDSNGRYVMPPGETAIRTRNFLCDIHSDNVVEVEGPKSPILYDQVLGFEDIRIIPGNNGNLFGSATVRQNNAAGHAEQVRITITPKGDCLQYRMQPEGPIAHEKNWMPVINGCDRAFVYRCDPTRIIDWNGCTISETAPEMAVENFSGGSQAIPFNDGWLALIHEAISSPIDSKRCYQHRFVWFDRDLRLQNVSRRFYFQANNQIEFAAGLCWHPDERWLLVSYGIRDCEAWLASVDASDVCSLLGLKALVDPPPDASSQPARPQKPPPASGGFHFGGDASWVNSQTNRPLAYRGAIEYARDALALLDLPRHPDYPKSWDSYLALRHALYTTTSDQRVLDAGGTRESVFLPGLGRLGFRELYNFNLDEATLGASERRINYQRRDITQTEAPNGSFRFVACLSVLEHGVDVYAFLREMARIIAPGGHLFLSVDYWEDPIDAGGQTAFGAPVKVFNLHDLQDLLFNAGVRGFHVAGNEAVSACHDRVVTWLGMQFTFFNLLLRREG
jgi:SAM-dependent methyltransferase